MADLPLTPIWGPVFKIETSTAVLGGDVNRENGVGGPNIGMTDLGNRTEYLKQMIAGLGEDATLVADLNTQDKTGLFRIGIGGSGHPVPGTVGTLMHTEGPGDETSQIAIVGIWQGFRTRTSGGWSAWQRTWSGASGIAAAQAEILAAFGNSDLSTNGYLFLPGGLVLQWGGFSNSPGGVTTPWPIAFPNSCFCAVATDNDPFPNILGINVTASTIKFYSSTGAGSAFVMALGN